MISKKAIVITLGCRLNCADSALLSSRLEECGYQLEDENASSFDLALVNSCAVTAEAVRKSRQTIRKLRKNHPTAVIVAAGCAVEADRAALESDGADIVLTNPDKKALQQALAGLEISGKRSLECRDNFSESVCSTFPYRSRAFVKIQEGCSNFCTYCIVPYVRGPERSRNFQEVLEDCKQLVDQGFPELVLTGVNTCAYCDNGKYLGDLVHAVSAIPGNFRIRLSSTEPHPNNRSLIDVMAETPKVCRFLHLSLQHGCNRILKEMHRHYTREEFAAFVEAARTRIPGIHLGSDVIAGFPGESEEDFSDGLDFVKKIGFSNLHVFTFSPRPGTPAAVMPNQIPAQIASARSAALRKAGEESKEFFTRSQLGKELEVIFETARNGVIHGWSDNYLAVSAPEGSYPLGEIVRITAAEENLGL